MLQNPHVQTTAGLWPDNQTLKEQISVPLTLSLQPFAHTHAQSTIPIESINQYRCQSCKAFINKLCFIRSTDEYDCSLCGCTNKTTKPLNVESAELNSLSYVLRAPQKQRLLQTQERLVVFVLDLSFYGQESKQYLIYALQVIRSFIRNVIDNNRSLNIMILGFDSGLHRFSIQSQDKSLLRIISSTSQTQADYEYLLTFQEQIGNIQKCRRNIQQVLNTLQTQIINNNLRFGKSLAILQAIKYSLKASQKYSGKIMIISGLRMQIDQFKNNIQRYYYDINQQHSFMLNKKQCIKGQLQNLLNHTQMTLSLSFINSHFINNMPFLYMATCTNGELRHYFPTQIILFFHRFKQDLQSILQQKTAFQSLLRVRYSTGLKLKGIFGSYRSTKITDQIQLLTCPQYRRYLFQFIIQGKITTDLIIVQFSTLYTDIKGHRYFIVETYANKISGSLNLIIPTINYTNVSFAYIRNITHNMDSVNSRNLQLALQQLCKKHVKAIRKYKRQKSASIQQGIIQQILLQPKSYIILTFLLIKHFIMNYKYTQALHFDLNAEILSKISTFEDSFNIIWPLVYAVRKDSWQMIQMREKYISQNFTAVFIDRCDQYYVYIADIQLQTILKKGNAKKNLLEMIQKQQSLSGLKRLIEHVKNQKGVQYIDILPLDSLHQLKILDLDSTYGFDKFIIEITK